MLAFKVEPREARGGGSSWAGRGIEAEAGGCAPDSNKRRALEQRGVASFSGWVTGGEGVGGETLEWEGKEN